MVDPWFEADEFGLCSASQKGYASFGYRRSFLATAISGIARSLKDTSSGIFRNVPSNSPKNAAIEGASAVAYRHAADLVDKARQNEKILFVPAEAEFYLYTQENARFEPQAELTPGL